jgi:glycosyltransferase involved in cell wall biosynthesis
MRITFVLPYAGMAGGNRVLAIYASRLMGRGHDVVVVSQALKKIPLRRKVKYFILGKGWLESPKAQPSYFTGLEVPHRVLERYRDVVDGDVPEGDVVIATHWTTAAGVERLARSKGAKAIFIQGYEVVPGAEPEAGLEASWRMPFHKITISNWLVKLARERFGDADVSQVPNAVDREQFHAEPRGRGERPTVGLLYSRSGFKGCEVALRAVELARREIPEIRVVCFGAEEVNRKLPLPRDSSFHYRPAQAEIRNIYSQCDVWLCGSRREGFHLPPLEAMACRCPVVSTRVGGPVDIVEEGVNGYLADVEDSAGLAGRLVDVLRLPDDRWRAMSDAAYATAARYSWEDATILFEKALERAVEKGRGRGAATMNGVRS